MSELNGVDKEVAYLQLELLRLGGHRAKDNALAIVTFGELMECERCEQIFEALQGTLRAAKKRKKIKFESEMLLKGVNDNVEITLLEAPPPGIEAAECTIHVGGGAESAASAGHGKGPNAWAKVETQASVKDYASRFSSSSLGTSAQAQNTKNNTTGAAAVGSAPTNLPEKAASNKQEEKSSSTALQTSTGRVKSLRASFTAAATTEEDSGLPVISGSPHSDGRPRSSSRTSRGSRGSFTLSPKGDETSPTFAASSTRPMSAKIANLRTSFVGGGNNSNDSNTSPKTSPQARPKSIEKKNTPVPVPAPPASSSTIQKVVDDTKPGGVAAMRSKFAGASVASSNHTKPPPTPPMPTSSQKHVAVPPLKAWAEEMGEDGIAKLSLSAVAKLGKEHFEAMEPEQLTVLLSNFESDLSESQKVALLEVIDNLEEDEFDDDDDEYYRESTMTNDENETAQRLEAEREAAETVEREAQLKAQRQAEIDAEKKRQADRLAALEAEKKRQAAIEAENKRQLEAEKKRQAKIQADKKRQAERQAELEAEKKREATRLAEVEAAKEKAAAEKEAEFKRATEKAEAQRRRAAELEAERQRAAEAEKARVAEETERQRRAEEAKKTRAIQEAERVKKEAEQARAAEEAERVKKEAEVQAAEASAVKNVEANENSSATTTFSSVTNSSSNPKTVMRSPPRAPVSLDVTPGSGGEWSNKPTTFQADVDNLDSEVAFKKKAKLAAESNEYRNALIWVLKLTDESQVDVSTIPFDNVHLQFGEMLQDGVLLCKLLNKICPGTIKPIPKPTTIAFKQLSNISSFCRGCQKLGLQKRECFDAQDLQKFDNLRAVLDTLHALNRRAKSTIQEFSGPYISNSDQ
eukprot:CAMPEP_0197307036 /NCGR_PEP_ID=MMETSP0891-20130614/4469_1 /TAXON_ID=44058 ORGANISM="Aureoumbra lagunensis, Strain CCMP1510" /NCGR_SAMPLE_ID=MMETSP0891 /ASSEMBLY_ACC=CAM_ASM_000534 /LENGTH=863 /DNA_ID=CAMNT_0042790009 /DNA_START=102 /DNA_END=2693 /DNA_ORIENTATION=+